MGKYEDILKTFDGTLESVDHHIQEEVLDLYADSGNAQALEGQHDIPIEVIRVVLEQPDLMQKALARRAGEFALKFVNQVLPAAIAKAASGETGSVQAAKLVAQVIGADGRRSVGRPTSKEEETKSEPGLEEKLTALTQATPDSPKRGKRKPKARSRLPRGTKK